MHTYGLKASGREMSTAPTFQMATFYDDETVQ